ncbi:MAG: hemerythrin domain-containing protein [Caulobacteraceae bacterium]
MSFIQAKPAATYDFYGPIHKALRLSLSDLMVRLGRADPRDAALLADLRRQLHLSARHLAHEDREIHTALEARCPGASERLVRAHDEHRAAFVELDVLIALVEQPDALPAAWRRLYLRFSEFVAEDLAHMAEEELVVLPVLQSLFTDAELAEIEGRVMQQIAPEDLVAYLRIMITAGSRADRLFLLGALRQAAPPEVFEGLVETAIKPRLTPEDWADLEQTLWPRAPTPAAKRFRLPIMI